MAILRMINGLPGKWPRPVRLDGLRVGIVYRDTKGDLREWMVALCTVRQGVASAMLDAQRDREDYVISLRLDRVVGFRLGGETINPLTFLETRFGIRFDTANDVLDQPPPSGPLAGKHFALTGEFFDGGYSTVRGLIEEAGGKVVGAVNPTTEALVAGEDLSPRNIRLRDAKKYGVRVISLDDLRTMLGS